MKFTKSIHWRLLLWIAALLGFSLLALDFAAYEIRFSSRVSLLDEELRRRVSVLSASVYAPGPMGDFDKRPPGPPPGNEGMPPNRFPNAPPQRGDRPGNPAPPPLNETQIDAAGRLYQPENAGGFYFTFWRKDVTAPCRQSTNCPAGVARPPLAALDTGTYVRTRGEFREAFHTTEHGDCILVGRTLAPELADARRFGGWLGLVSVVVLAFGLAGAWFIIAGALRPVEKISAAAAKISSGDLSQRINVAETESELGQLAVVLNSTFARLDAAFTRQKQFTADAAHELRTPVTVLLTHAQNGLATGCACDEHRESFEACQRAAQRMKKLISALLALARLDAGQGTVQRAKFDLARTARECMELVQPLAGENRVKISGELPALEISGDAEQMAQVLINLLANAIQYNRPGGEVHVRLERRDRQAVLTVSDTGIGIPAEDLPRVFERFYRADKARSSSGVGMGLTIAQAIITGQGGTIEVASEENAGTTFTVKLPA